MACVAGVMAERLATSIDDEMRDADDGLNSRPARGRIGACEHRATIDQRCDEGSNQQRGKDRMRTSKAGAANEVRTPRSRSKRSQMDRGAKGDADSFADACAAARSSRLSSAPPSPLRLVLVVARTVVGSRARM
jgi:hypothetical protein